MLLALLLAAAPQQGAARLSAIRNGVAERGAHAATRDACLAELAARRLRVSSNEDR